MHKAVDTNWPPDSVVHQGVTVSLSSIFNECGIVLQIEKITLELPLLAGGRSYELEDLNASLEKALKQNTSSSPSWVAHVLIVPDILIVRNSHYRRPLGLMFDTNIQGKSARRGCAIAYKRLCSQPQLYVRTIAHELGHIFNLGHPGEASEPFSPDAINTVMIPTENLRPRNQIPATLEFRFSTVQRNWLAHAPDCYVCPGESEYGSRPSNWPAAFFAP